MYSLPYQCGTQGASLMHSGLFLLLQKIEMHHAKIPFRHPKSVFVTEGLLVFSAVSSRKHLVGTLVSASLVFLVNKLFPFVEDVSSLKALSLFITYPLFPELRTGSLPPSRLFLISKYYNFGKWIWKC